jgi:activator of HSP90 ATPase
MATYDFVVSETIDAAPIAVYEAWMSSEGHSQMTGAAAYLESQVGGAYRAWNGYITGTTTLLDPPHHLVQSWRSEDFGDGDADSVIDVTFDAVSGGTLVTVRHSGVPFDQRGYEEGGWAESYFAPMRTYFGS